MALLQFKGKQFVQNHHLMVKFHELIPKKDKSLTKKAGLNDNLIIHGDNLKALKALLPTYGGKVKCVYIDPPYNTGNEKWKYNDNVNSPMMQEWLGKVVDREDLTRHDKWLCMMMPRLKLLRELLRDDGVIFISIDDNEQHHLRMLMDEIFGEENFITNIIWQKKYTQSNDARYFSDTHDFILVYAKRSLSFIVNSLDRTEKQNARYENSDNDPRGVWMTQPLHAKSGTDKTYEFIFKNGVKWKPPIGTFPRYSIETLKKADRENKIWFGAKGNAVPRMKKYLVEMKEGVIPKTIWLYQEVGSNDDARRTLKDMALLQSEWVKHR
ncbi:MAG: site-specific DNA-methyltransferase [Minisyncoccia bacterium]